MNRTFVVYFGFLFFCATSAWAVPDTNVPLTGGDLDVQYSAGSGSNAAYFVVDFAGSGSSPGGTYAFAFNWDTSVTPNPTPSDALFSIEAVSGPATVLQMQLDDFGGSTFHNYFVNTFSYGADTANPGGFPDAWTMFLGTYGSSQVTWGNPNDLNFGISAVDQDGAQIYSLENGHFYGFDVGTFGQDFLIHAENPRLPVAAPEPSALILAGIGCALLGARRIAHRRFLLRNAMESAQTPHEIARG